MNNLVSVCGMFNRRHDRVLRAWLRQKRKCSLITDLLKWVQRFGLRLFVLSENFPILRYIWNLDNFNSKLKSQQIRQHDLNICLPARFLSWQWRVSNPKKNLHQSCQIETREFVYLVWRQILPPYPSPAVPECGLAGAWRLWLQVSFSPHSECHC